jgi:hypothetical protein
LGSYPNLHLPTDFTEEARKKAKISSLGGQG